MVTSTFPISLRPLTLLRTQAASRVEITPPPSPNPASLKQCDVYIFLIFTLLNLRYPSAAQSRPVSNLVHSGVPVPTPNHYITLQPCGRKESHHANSCTMFIRRRTRPVGDLRIPTITAPITFTDAPVVTHNKQFSGRLG